MLHTRVFGQVVIEKLGARLFSSSKAFKIVEAFSVNGISEVRSFIRVEDWKTEYPLQEIYSLYMKNLENGALTICFIKKDLSNKNLQSKEITDERKQIFLMISNADPHSLKLFSQAIIGELENARKKVGISMISKRKNESQLDNLDQRVIERILEKGLMKKRNLFCNFNSKIIIVFIGKFLNVKEFLGLSLLSKEAQQLVDNCVLNINFVKHNPPPQILYQLLKRFKNLDQLRFSKHIDVKLNAKMGELRLNSLRNLVLDTTGIKEESVLQFMRIARKLSQITIPANLKESSLRELLSYTPGLIKGLRFKQAENNYQINDPLLLEFLTRQDRIEQLKIPAVGDVFFDRIAQQIIRLNNLRELMIKTINITAKSRFSEFLNKLPLLERVWISSSNNLDPEISIRILTVLLTLPRLSALYFSQLIPIDCIADFITEARSRGITLKRIKFSTPINDDILSTVLSNCPYLEWLDISKCTSIQGNCFDTIGQNNRSLRVIMVGFEEYRLNLLKKGLSKNNLKNCRIILKRKSKF